MLELDTRQIATIVWSITIVLALSLWPQTRRAAWPALKEVAKAASAWKVIVPIVSYLAYSALAVIALYSLGTWQSFPLIDALVIIFFLGLPMFFNANNEKSGEQLFKKTLRETIGISALVAFYIGLAPLTLVGELFLQPAVGVLSLLAFFASRDTAHKPARILFNGVLGFIGLWLIIRTANVIIETWHVQDVNDATEKLLLSVILPTLLLPAVYIFALIMRYEIIFLVSKNLNGGKKMRPTARLACPICIYNKFSRSCFDS